MKSTTSKWIACGIALVALVGVGLALHRHLKQDFDVPKIEDEPESAKVSKEPFTEIIPGYGIVARSGPNLQIEVGIDANDSKNVRVGQTANVRLPQHSRRMRGKVAQLIRYAGSETGQSLCWITAPNPDGKDHTGEFAIAGVEWVSGQPVLVVPTAALMVKEEKTWVVTEDNKPKEVKVGRQNDEKVEILDGLEEGASVLTSGAIGYLFPDFKAAGGD